MTSRMLLATTLCGVSLCLSAVAPCLARDLMVVGRGGSLQQAQEDAYFRPFTAATKIPLSLRSWHGGLAPLRDKTEQGSADWDLVQVNAAELLVGCDEGLFDKLNWAALGNRDKYVPPQAATDCGAGTALTNTVLVWDRDKFQTTPTWSDFWDVARYPGKRGLRRDARTNLEIALMADGVAPGEVYRVLRTDDGVDRAFRKLDQIKPYLVWWTPDAPAGQVLGAGEVLFSTADSVSVALANRVAGRHYGVQWTGSLYTIRSWAMMKGTPNAADAAKLLTSMADPIRQANLASTVPVGPVVKGANELLPPDMAAASPTLPANLANALQVDEAFWRDNGDKLRQRFDTWLAH
ncbi:extracellular solute-binding protein [Acidisphaera sp. L21]|uniref:extracellular solute-binding protein n=1 Tax=Acidisphaera sp. L21 TaxID=1641851 RepID=UPI00131DED5B|nr:extracellular solute-binding protein [Acidisphaera sp. L21]